MSPSRVAEAIEYWSQYIKPDSDGRIRFVRSNDGSDDYVIRYPDGNWTISWSLQYPGETFDLASLAKKLAQG